MITAALKSIAGHPLTDFVSEVWSDLNRVGIPVHLVSEAQRTCGPDGVDVSVAEDCLVLTWNVPDEGLHWSCGDDDAGLSYSVGVLTAALVGVLASRGYHVCSEPADPPFAPPVFVFPHR
ncbi:hypothetical protein ACWGDT_24350 [Streptomyces avermitilis]